MANPATYLLRVPQMSVLSTDGECPLDTGVVTIPAPVTTVPIDQVLVIPTAIWHAMEHDRLLATLSWP